VIGYNLALLAFTTGMVVTVNPCGFAMLPAYLSFFVSDDAAATPPSGHVGRALVVGAAVTVGFVATFALAGLVVGRLTDRVYDVAPWLSLLIGAALVTFGVALLAGLLPSLRGPHLDRGGRTRSITSMAVFGASYAVASIGCTLPLFVGTMSTMFGRGLVSGLEYFTAYAAGFGLVVTALAITLAFGQRSLLNSLRRAMPYVHRAAGVLLVVTGTYVAYYGWVEIRSGQGRGVPNDGAVTLVSGWSSQASTWIENQGGERIGAALALIVLTATAVALHARRTSRLAPTEQPSVRQ